MLVHSRIGTFLLSLCALALLAAAVVAAPQVEGELRVSNLEANNTLAQGPDGKRRFRIIHLLRSP